MTIRDRVDPLGVWDYYDVWGKRRNATAEDLVGFLSLLVVVGLLLGWFIFLLFWGLP